MLLGSAFIFTYDANHSHGRAIPENPTFLSEIDNENEKKFDEIQKPHFTLSIKSSFSPGFRYNVRFDEKRS
jgi:hypothetical protein